MRGRSGDSDSRLVSIGNPFAAIDDRPDDFTGESSCEQETHLPCALAWIGATGRIRIAEAAQPDCTGPLKFGMRERTQLLGNQLWLDAVGAQLLPDYGEAGARRAPVNDRFGESVIRKQPGRLEFNENTLELLGRLGVTRQFAAQFGSTVLPTGQVTKRPPLERQGPGSSHRCPPDANPSSGRFPGRPPPDDPVLLTDAVFDFK